MKQIKIAVAALAVAVGTTAVWAAPTKKAPATDWTYTAPADWPPVLQQDFTNMAAVQQGMKNIGFRGTQPNPYMERSIVSLHRNLAAYMGTGTPQPLS